MIILMMVVIPVCSAASTTTGFVWPTGSDYTGGYYKYGSFVGKDQSGKDLFHLGQDFKAEIGSPVYAIADGTLIEQRTDVSSYGPYEGPGGVIKILHTDSNGRQFLALYGHVNNFKLPYACGAPVRSGQVIGYIAPYSHKDGTSIPHLHFGINLVPSSVAWQGHGTSLGSWVDPMNFLKSYSPRNSNPTQQTGSISVSSWPTGASVYLDGVSYGTTPAQGSLQINSLKVGNHQLKVTKSNYLDYTVSPYVQAGTTSPFSITLTPVQQTEQTGSISVSSWPTGASVYLDGISYGTTPAQGSLQINSLKVGNHQLKVTKSNYLDYTVSPYVQAGTTSPFSITLTPVQQTEQTGSISVSSWPTGASVYLDGISYGTTPAQGSLQINSLPIGNHQLKLYKIGYLDNGLQAVVQSNSVNSYNCNLVASLQPQQQPSVAFISNPPRASVYVDNVYSGETPVSGSLIINNLNLGHHTAKFVKSGYIDSNWGFDIFPWSNSDTPITANLIGR